MIHMNGIDAVHTPRRATLDDIADIARVHRLAFFDAMPHMPVLHTPEDDLEFFATVVFPGTEVWVTEQDGVTTGFIAFRPDWVDHLYIHPDFQRCGLGALLLALARTQADSLSLWTFQCNHRARHFYEKHGFCIAMETDGSTNEERQPDVLYVWSRRAADTNSTP